jgi:quercetin dioxygenase-like cupin family protein
MTVELDIGQPLLLPPGGGEVVGDSPERRVEILSDRDELHATWSRFAPGRDGADPHIHRRHTDLFYVLAGELTIGLGPDRDETVVPAGSLVVAPPLVIHAFRNGSATNEVRYLNFHAPGGGFADYLRGRQPGFDSEDPPGDGGRPKEDATITQGLIVDLDEIRIAEVRGEREAALAGDDDRHTEFFYVLEGTLTFSLGTDDLRAEPGTWIQIPAGIEYKLTGSDEARYLEIHAPGRSPEQV